MVSTRRPPTTRAISGVASVLAGSLSPVLSYDILEPMLDRFGISASPRIARRALRSALQEAERFPQPRLAGIGMAQRNVVSMNTVRRAAYIVSATRRIASEMSAARARGETLEQGLSEAISRENSYFVQHVNADAQRVVSASTVDALAGQYGDVLGWYAYEDGRTSPECAEANGKNFRASEPPNIGYPGVVHVACRCYPGPPHREAEMLASPSVQSVPLVASNLATFDVVEFTQRLADFFGVDVELVKPRKKVSQKSVDYRKTESDAKHRCGTCVMYHASRCDLVVGYIEPSYVCDRWEAKPQAVELAIGQRHVRTAEGVYFFHEPIGTPITEGEYQQLLAQRKAAKEQYEVGHPARVGAERAIRTARKMRGDADVDTPGKFTPADVDDPVGSEVAEMLKRANDVLTSVKSQAAATGKSVSKTAIPRTSQLAEAKLRLESLRRERAGRQVGGKANLAERATDRRIAQGQTVSHFVHPATGRSLSKSEIGDTYEALFDSHGAQLLEDRFGGTYQIISHAQGGARTTPLDFELGKYGGELKTLSATARNQKTAIKKEEIDRKLAEVARRKLRPLMVVQVVNQQTGTVDVYAHPAFASKMVRSLEHLGSYKYTPDDFHDAQKRAGYGPIISGNVAQPNAMAARLTSDTEYQRLLEARLKAKKMYPVGHPERVKAEKAVRDARKQIHTGVTATSRGAPVTTAGTPPTETSLSAKIEYEYVWSTSTPVQLAFAKVAEEAINRQIEHQSSLLPHSIGDVPVIVKITEKPMPSGRKDTTLGSYQGNSRFGIMRLSPRIFPHVILMPGDGRLQSASFFLKGATPSEILVNGLKTHWWVPTDRKWTLSDNVIAHEAGHGVAHSVFDRSGTDIGIPDDPQFWKDFAKTVGASSPKPAIRYEPSGKPISTTEPSVVERKIHSHDSIARWIQLNRARIATAVSDYGASLKDGTGSPHELFAELWAEYSLSSNPRAPAKFYGDYVTKLLRGRVAEEARSVAEREASLRGLPADVREFVPEKLPVGSSVTFTSLHLQVKRTRTDHWEITLLSDQGDFRGAWGRSTAAKVKQLLEDEWLRISGGGK